MWHGRDRILLNSGLKYFREQSHIARLKAKCLQATILIESGGAELKNYQYEFINEFLQEEFEKVYADFAIFLSSLTFINQHET